MLGYVTTNYYDVRCNCNPFVSNRATSVKDVSHFCLPAIDDFNARVSARIVGNQTACPLLVPPFCVYPASLLWKLREGQLKVSAHGQIEYNNVRATMHTVRLRVKNTAADLDHLMQNSVSWRTLLCAPIFFKLNGGTGGIMTAING